MAALLAGDFRAELQMKFETIFGEIRSSLLKRIRDRWTNEQDCEIVEPEILRHVENKLKDDWPEVRTNGCEFDPETIEILRGRGLQEVSEVGNKVAFEALWRGLERYYRERIRRSLQGRSNAEHDGEDVLQELAIRLLPKVDGSWKFDPQRGFRFCTYAAWALHNTTSDFRRGAARRHAYRLDRCHLESLLESGVPEDWLRKLSPIIGEYYPTFGYFSGAVRKSLRLEVNEENKVKELRFDDHRICTIFDAAWLPDVSHQDEVEDRCEENDPAIAAEAYERLDRIRAHTAGCLKALHDSDVRCGSNKDITGPILANIYYLQYWQNLSKAEIARKLLTSAKGHDNPTGLLTRALYQARSLMKACLESKLDQKHLIE